MSRPMLADPGALGLTPGRRVPGLPRGLPRDAPVVTGGTMA